MQQGREAEALNKGVHLEILVCKVSQVSCRENLQLDRSVTLESLQLSTLELEAARTIQKQRGADTLAADSLGCRVALSGKK